ncbi:MAG: DUF1850 domain-containing protein [Propylenella sp.]
MTGLCVVAAGAVIHVAASAFSLSWTHTVEKTLWQEDWLIEEDQLVLMRARIQGTGAGMEPPPEARLEEGFYVWEPMITRSEITLRRDPHAGDWRLCAAGRCAALGEWLGAEADPVRLLPSTEADCAPKR